MLKLRFSFSFLNIDKKPRYRDPFFIIPTDAQENSLIFRVKQFKKYLLDFSQYRFEVQKKKSEKCANSGRSKTAFSDENSHFWGTLKCFYP